MHSYSLYGCKKYYIHCLPQKASKHPVYGTSAVVVSITRKNTGMLLVNTAVNTSLGDL